jgi:hypothetical protein
MLLPFNDAGETNGDHVQGADYSVALLHNRDGSIFITIMFQFHDGARILPYFYFHDPSSPQFCHFLNGGTHQTLDHKTQSLGVVNAKKAVNCDQIIQTRS